MKTIIRTIPHKDQRYNTVGDYTTGPDGTITILVSDLGNPDMEYLIALHEMVEKRLCDRDGITDQMIDAFDFDFANNRDPDDASEPGDDPRAPYYAQHQFATKVEKMMATQMGVDWGTYMNRSAEVMATYNT